MSSDDEHDLCFDDEGGEEIYEEEEGGEDLPQQLPPRAGVVPPSLAVTSDELIEGLSDKYRIMQAYNFVNGRLSREEAEAYDLDVSHLVFGNTGATYREFWLSSRFNAAHLPQGEKPTTHGDRRRKRTRLPEPEWQRCPSCGATLCDEFVEGESLLCDCGLVLRDGDREMEVGFIERENYEHRTNSIYKKPSEFFFNLHQRSRAIFERREIALSTSHRSSRTSSRPACKLKMSKKSSTSDTESYRRSQR